MPANVDNELAPLIKRLQKLRSEGTVLVAVLYGSYASGTPHTRSDIDLALFVNVSNRDEEMKIVDEILTSVEKEVSILRLDDEDESPFVVQAALKGAHLVEPDEDTLYQVADRVLHESEGIRYGRALHA